MKTDDESMVRNPPKRVFVRLNNDDECKGVDGGIQAFADDDTPDDTDDGGHYWAEYELKRCGRLREGWSEPPISRLFVPDQPGRKVSR